MEITKFYFDKSLFFIDERIYTAYGTNKSLNSLLVLFGCS